MHMTASRSLLAATDYGSPVQLGCDCVFLSRSSSAPLFSPPLPSFSCLPPLLSPSLLVPAFLLFACFFSFAFCFLVGCICTVILVSHCPRSLSAGLWEFCRFSHYRHFLRPCPLHMHPAGLTRDCTGAIRPGYSEVAGCIGQGSALCTVWDAGTADRGGGQPQL